MNLKESFRYQNKLQALMNEAQAILNDNRNVTRLETTLYHKKVIADAENVTTVEQAPSDYADRINQVASFLMRLLEEHEKLSKAIHSAKAALAVDMDSEVGLNAKRQSVANTMRGLVDLRCSEELLYNGGIGYRFNAEGNQVSYRCDAKRVTTINYDRKQMRAYMGALNRKSDDVSTQLDRCLVNSNVDYTSFFDVNDSFAAAFESFCETQR